MKNQMSTATQTAPRPFPVIPRPTLSGTARRPDPQKPVVFKDFASI